MGLANKWQKTEVTSDELGFSHRCSFEITFFRWKHYYFNLCCLIFMLFRLFLDRNHQFSMKCVSISHFNLTLALYLRNVPQLKTTSSSKCLRWTKARTSTNGYLSSTAWNGRGTWTVHKMRPKTSRPLDNSQVIKRIKVTYLDLCHPSLVSCLSLVSVLLIYFEDMFCIYKSKLGFLFFVRIVTYPATSLQQPFSRRCPPRWPWWRGSTVLSIKGLN